MDNPLIKMLYATTIADAESYTFIEKIENKGWSIREIILTPEKFQVKEEWEAIKIRIR